MLHIISLNEYMNKAWCLFLNCMISWTRASQSWNTKQGVPHDDSRASHAFSWFSCHFRNNCFTVFILDYNALPYCFLSLLKLRIPKLFRASTPVFSHHLLNCSACFNICAYAASVCVWTCLLVCACVCKWGAKVDSTLLCCCKLKLD